MNVQIIYCIGSNAFLFVLITMYVYDFILALSILRTSCKYCIKPRITFKYTPVLPSQTRGQASLWLVPWPAQVIYCVTTSHIHTHFTLINTEAASSSLLQSLSE